MVEKLFKRDKYLHAKIDGMTQLEKYGIDYIVSFIKKWTDVDNKDYSYCDVRKDGKLLRAWSGKMINDTLNLDGVALSSEDVKHLIQETEMEMLLGNSSDPFDL